MRVSRRALVTIGVAVFSVGLLSPALATVEPNNYEDSLEPGESVTVDKDVTTPDSGAGDSVDVMIDVDLSGSYADDLPNLRGQLPGVFDQVSAASDARFGLATFVDHPYSPWGNTLDGDYAYRLDQDLTHDRGDFVDAVEAMDTGYGGDGPESQYESLYQIATGAGRDTPGEQDVASGQGASFRAGVLRVVVITTDAPFHVAGDSECYDGSEPACPFPYPGPGHDETVDALKAANIRVIALKAPGSGTEMDDLAVETGGSVQFTTSSSSDIADAILAGIEDIGSSVHPQVSPECPLEISFSPQGYDDVAPGETVEFAETIAVPEDAEPGTKHCTVDFGTPGTQDVIIHVGCVEDGVNAVDLSGIASGTVHDEVEPLASSLSGQLGGEDLGDTVHDLNCDVVVPVEDTADELVGGLGLGF